jgi:hypothetical protein
MNSQQRRQARRRVQSWLTSLGQGAERQGKAYFVAGLALTLAVWGISLIGVVINVWLGGIVLAIAFGLGAHAFWLWVGSSRFHIVLRILIVLTAAAAYIVLVGRQMVVEYEKDYPDQFRVQSPPFRPAPPKPPDIAFNVINSKREVHPDTKTLVVEGPYDLTEPRRMRLLDLLRRQVEPRDAIRIGCTAWSEASCVAAGKFLIVFSEAGWVIDSNRVFRMEPMIPKAGIALVSSSVDAEKRPPDLPPHLGVWHKMNPSEVTIWFALRNLGIPVNGSSQEDLPVRTLGVFFGPEPKRLSPMNPNEESALRKARQSQR